MEISRRDMLKGAGLFAAGLAATGAFTATGCSSEDAGKAAFVGAPEAWDYEADVVVVGFGCAGAGAAAQAAEAGASVVVLEKMSEQYAGGNIQLHAGWFSPGQGSKSYLDMNGHKITEAEAQACSDAQTKAYDWACTLPGVETNKFQMLEGGSAALYAAMKETCINAGVQVLYEAPATGLVFDPETREVKGVYAAQGDKTIAVKALKGVILCSGDYASNPELISDLHYPSLVSASLGTPAATGDGLKMAMELGAKLGYMTNVSVELNGYALREPSEEYGTSFLYNYQGFQANLSTNCSKIIVNAQGNRFVNEDTPLAHNRNSSQLSLFDITYALGGTDNGYANLPMFLVMDSECFSSAPFMLNQGNGWRVKHGIYEWSADNQAEVEKGWIKKADTLEELACLMVSSDYLSGVERVVPAEGLAATVKKYNDDCATGVDAFGRQGATPIATPPFYAVELIPSLMYTIGGLMGDEKCRVLNWANEPISRLYRAGSIGLGVEFYPTGLSGSLAHAMIASADVVALEPWETQEK